MVGIHRAVSMEGRMAVSRVARRLVFCWVEVVRYRVMACHQAVMELLRSLSYRDREMVRYPASCVAVTVTRRNQAWVSEIPGIMAVEVSGILC